MNIKLKYNKLDFDNYIINSNFDLLKHHINIMYPNTSFKKFTNIADLFNIIINSKQKNNKNAYSNTISHNDLSTILTISILKPIEIGLSKEDFIKTLEKNIYLELDKIN